MWAVIIDVDQFIRRGVMPFTPYVVMWADSSQAELCNAMSRGVLPVGYRSAFYVVCDSILPSANAFIAPQIVRRITTEWILGLAMWMAYPVKGSF